MVIQPKTRGFICTTAHPAGCCQNVAQQIAYTKAMPKSKQVKNALVIGASMGYGLASRIALAYSCDAATIGVIFDKPASEKRTATAGWYNTAAFEKIAAEDGIYAKTVNGDAFSQEIKEQVIDLIKKDLGSIDMVVYSMAAPRRTTADGTVYSSVLKTVGEPYTNKTVDLRTNQIQDITVSQATEQEIYDTVKVMGGEDWMDWMQALADAGVLAPNAVTVAYSYIGPALTHPMYKDGSIGMAKRHLYETSLEIRERLPGVKAYISVNKALVTQSSAAIPIVPLYISLLYKVMKEKGNHEGCMEQIYRMMHDKLLAEPPVVDGEGYLRPDDWEMQEDVQKEVARLWEQVTTENLCDLSDIEGYWDDFFRLFGFRMEGVDYEQDVEPDVEIPSLS